jgi:hypothetical protein
MNQKIMTRALWEPQLGTAIQLMILCLWTTSFILRKLSLIKTVLTLSLNTFRVKIYIGFFRINSILSWEWTKSDHGSYFMHNKLFVLWKLFKSIILYIEISSQKMWWLISKAILNLLILGLLEFWPNRLILELLLIVVQLDIRLLKFCLEFLRVIVLLLMFGVLEFFYVS